MKLALIMAMKEEAKPVIEDFEMQSFDCGLVKTWNNQIYRSSVFPDFYLITNGHDKKHSSVSKVGTQAAAISCFIALEILKVDHVINAGTAGAFTKNDSKIGDVYLCKKAFYHDRRVPISPEWEDFAKGDYNLNFDKQWIEKYNFKEGNVSTGNALDFVEEDLNRLHSFPAHVKEMEAACIAELCREVDVPLTVIKSVTDLVDGGRVTAEEFMENLHLSSKNLSTKVLSVLHEEFYS
jgi:nucleoside phosphorylase